MLLWLLLILRSTAAIQRISIRVELIDNLWAALDDLIDNISIVFNVIERDKEYCFDVLDWIDSFLPWLRLGVSQHLDHLLQLIEDTHSVFGDQDGLQQLPFVERAVWRLIRWFGCLLRHLARIVWRKGLAHYICCLNVGLKLNEWKYSRILHLASKTIIIYETF